MLRSDSPVAAAFSSSNSVSISSFRVGSDIQSCVRFGSVALALLPGGKRQPGTLPMLISTPEGWFSIPLYFLERATMQSVLQILKLNEPRSGEKNGRKWEMQDAECIILDDHGTVDQVGVLMIPKDLMGKVQPGIFMGSFALRADTSREGQRRIQAVLTGLQPYVVKGAAK